jgi:hypothetical protein
VVCACPRPCVRLGLEIDQYLRHVLKMDDAAL